MSTHQIFKGKYRFADTAAEANARELFARATADGALVIAEAFVFGDREITIAFDGFAGAICYQPTTTLVGALAEQAKTGTVRCVFDSGSERTEERIGAACQSPRPDLPRRDVARVVLLPVRSAASRRARGGAVGLGPRLRALRS